MSEPSLDRGRSAARMRRAGFAVAGSLVAAAFIVPLTGAVRFALHSDLQSHILLVPFISGYLVYLGRSRLPSVCKPGKGAAAILFLAAGGLLAAGLLRADSPPGEAAALTLPVLAFLACETGAIVLFLGVPTLRATAFPLILLLFMVPIPEPAVHVLQAFLQRWSADAAYGLLKLSGTPVFRDGLTFYLPGLTVTVAEECSGIHSSLVLFITSLVAGHLFLRKVSSRAFLALAVVPIGIIRNGFRVAVISLLTVHVDERVMESDLHRRGGPLFFVLSLFLLMGLLWILRRRERKRVEPPKRSEHAAGGVVTAAENGVDQCES
jgi:exosortase C (VPDSG-CTERM-specific)